MNDQSPEIMVSREAIIQRALDRVAETSSGRYKLFELPEASLVDLGSILADRSKTKADAYRWLVDRYGDEFVSNGAFYNFAQAFKGFYVHERQQAYQRFARLVVDESQADQTLQLSSMAVHRLTMLLTEKLLDVETLDDLDHRAVRNMIAQLTSISKGQLAREELDLKIADAERRATESAAKVAKLEADAEEKRRAINRRVNQLETRFNELLKVTRSGGAVPDEILEDLRKELLGLKDEAGVAA